MLLVSDSLLKNPIKAAQLLYQQKCTIWFSVPSLIVYCLTLRALTVENLSLLRLIIFGGEGFPKSPLRKLYSLLSDKTQLVNVYGPTECTCICSSYFVKPSDLDSDDLLPLGFVAPNFEFMICDNDGVIQNRVKRASFIGRDLILVQVTIIILKKLLLALFKTLFILPIQILPIKQEILLFKIPHPVIFIFLVELTIR